MQRSAQLTKKQDAKLENDVSQEPMTKKSRSDNRISKIGTLDNGTMVEAFKYLNYCQLAKNSLVSKRFLDVIHTHRHKLALLYVDSIRMDSRYNNDPTTKIFDNELSPEEYNEWVVRNNYAKQTSLKISAALDSLDYELSACGAYKAPNGDRAFVFYALIKELNHETWPLFEHFIHLLSNPFVFIRNIKLISQTDVYNLLAATIDRRNRGRLQCEVLDFYFNANAQNFFSWIKEHVRCVKFRLTFSCSSANRDEQLLDFFATGSHCSSEIVVTISHISKAVIIDFVQKFVGLKNSVESQMVELICGIVSNATAEALKSNYAKFFVKEEKSQYGWNHAPIYEFVNADIGKKMQLAILNENSRDVILKLSIL